MRRLVAAGVCVSAMISCARSESASGQVSPSEETTLNSEGRAIGTDLGLRPTEREPDCRFFAEFDDPLGYCLDDVVSSEEEAVILGRAINGAPLNAVEQAVLQNVARREQLLVEIHELLSEAGRES
jgi:hypothetical protein